MTRSATQAAPAIRTALVTTIATPKTTAARTRLRRMSSSAKGVHAHRAKGCTVRAARARTRTVAESRAQQFEEPLAVPAIGAGNDGGGAAFDQERSDVAGDAQGRIGTAELPAAHGAEKALHHRGDVADARDDFIAGEGGEALLERADRFRRLVDASLRDHRAGRAALGGVEVFAGREILQAQCAPVRDQSSECPQRD